MTTILLDPSTWDLALDARRSIALASEPYATAQSVATSCRLWLGESLYDVESGVDYPQILGEKPNAQFIRGQIIAAAKKVPGVTAAKVANLGLTSERVLTGTIEFTTSEGAQSVNF